MLRRSVILAFLLIGSAHAVAVEAPKKIWACAAEGTSTEDLYLVAWGKRSYVKLYESRIWGNFYEEGESLRWDFGRTSSNVARYSIILHPDGDVDYYDFRDVAPDQAVSASYHYNCRLAQG